MKLAIDKKIKQMRFEKGLTQEELGGLIGVSAQSISKWERGEGYPDIEFLPSLANFFEISVDELIGADAKTVRDVLGHDSVRTTDIYLHPYEDGKKRAAGLVGSVIGEVFRETENIACDSRENA